MTELVKTTQPETNNYQIIYWAVEFKEAVTVRIKDKPKKKKLSTTKKTTNFVFYIII